MEFTHEQITEIISEITNDEQEIVYPKEVNYTFGNTISLVHTKCPQKFLSNSWGHICAFK